MQHFFLWPLNYKFLTGNNVTDDDDEEALSDYRISSIRTLDQNPRVILAGCIRRRFLLIRASTSCLNVKIARPDWLKC